MDMFYVSIGSVTWTEGTGYGSIPVEWTEDHLLSVSIS